MLQYVRVMWEYMIKLDELLNGLANSIKIDEEYLFADTYLENTEIKELSKISVNGIIYLNSGDELFINVSINGEMTLEDSISLNPIKCPFSIEFDDKVDENLIKNENSLDIMEFLWQNIVLEVPLKITEVTDYSKLSGDGWKLINEEELHSNNPFSVLLDNEEKE